MEVRIGRRTMIPLLALCTVSEYYRSERKPPVTTALIATNTLIYLRPSSLDSLIPSIDQVCFNPHLILNSKHLNRFFLSPFYHIGEPHLVYNMLSLLFKGVQLEASMGSLEFASMIASLLALSQGITLMLSKSLLLFFDYERPYYNEYTVGFSGVLFAMKVVLNNSRSDDDINVLGFKVPSRCAAWAELILIQMLVPRVSFLGHLGGILAGILYLKLRGIFSGSDPVAVFVGGVAVALNRPLRFLRGMFGFRRGRISGRGSVGQGRRTRRCQARCKFDESRLFSVYEMSGNNGLAFSFPWNSGGRFMDELRRRRRIDRFGGRCTFVKPLFPS